MTTWPLTKAKENLSEFIHQAQAAPQMISKHGVPVAVALSVEKYAELFGQKEDIVSFFKNSPLYGEDLNFDRAPSVMRDLDL